MSLLASSPYRSSPEQVAHWVAAGNTAQVALLPENTPLRRLAETLTALANGHGGVMILGAGAATGGILPGLSDPPRARDQALEAALLAEPPLVLPLPELIRIGERTVCLLHVPPGLSQVYHLKGQYWLRAGKENRVMTTAELRALLIARGEAHFEATLVPDAVANDLDEAAVSRYLDKLSGVPVSLPGEVLHTRGCLKPDAAGVLAPTYAGLLLFGRAPQRVLPSAEIIAVRYAGNTMGDEFVREDIRGTLGEQIRRAEAFLAANMRRGMRIRGFTREEVPEYPPAVAREAVVNAVAHRDYSLRGDSIRLLMFNDRMEVYSPGRLPGHVTLENMLHERFSRNEVIVQILSDMGFIERLGYGIDRMIAAMQEADLPAPRFEESAAGFRVVLRGHGHNLVSASAGGGRWGNELLNPRQEEAMVYVAQQGRITNSAFQALVPDVSPETIRRDLADLVERGLLMKIGEKRATYYILK
ncbi:MAG: ATP-binding protein [Caldilineales bacterium]